MPLAVFIQMLFSRVDMACSFRTSVSQIRFAVDMVMGTTASERKNSRNENTKPMRQNGFYQRIDADSAASERRQFIVFVHHAKADEHGEQNAHRNDL